MRTKLGLVATVLDNHERSRIDAAAGQYVSTVHADNMEEAIRTVRERPISAVLISPGYVSRRDVNGVARLVREFPGIPAVALLSKADISCSERLLELGFSGVRSLVDLTRRDGWSQLRAVVGRHVATTSTRILTGIAPALAGASSDTMRFFEAVVILAPSTLTSRELARHLEIRASTFISRFFRARLPSPKRYLAAVRLIHAAGMFDIPGLSISDVAYRLDYSSPQSFSRHVKACTGMTAGEFRERARFEPALHDLKTRLILPFRATFRSFHPFDEGVGNPGQQT